MITADRVLIPATFSVAHRVYTGLILDALNNEIPAWDDPVKVKVYGWQVTTDQQRGDYTSRNVIQADLYVPRELVVKIRDRFTLSGHDYEVDQITDVTHGFHHWSPGRVIKLVRITPKGVPV